MIDWNNANSPKTLGAVAYYDMGAMYPLSLYGTKNQFATGICPNLISPGSTIYSDLNIINIERLSQNNMCAATRKIDEPTNTKMLSTSNNGWYNLANNSFCIIIQYYYVNSPTPASFLFTLGTPTVGQGCYGGRLVDIGSTVCASSFVYYISYLNYSAMITTPSPIISAGSLVTAAFYLDTTAGAYGTIYYINTIDGSSFSDICIRVLPNRSVIADSTFELCSRALASGNNITTGLWFRTLKCSVFNTLPTLTQITNCMTWMHTTSNSYNAHSKLLITPNYGINTGWNGGINASR